MVSFAQVPETNHSPGFHTEVDYSAAGTSPQPRDVLIIGYSTSGPLSDPRIILGDAHPWPRKSQIAAMIRAFRRTNRSSKIVAIALDDPAAGGTASGTLTVTGPATEDGTLYVYVAGKRIQVGVTDGDADSDIATAIADAINADLDVPANASALAAVVTVESDFDGSEGNFITLAVDPKDDQLGVEGVSVAVVAMSGGSGAPDLAAALALVPDERYFGIVSGFSDSQALTDLAADIDRRWEATEELLGHGFVGLNGTFAAMITEAVNAIELTLVGAGASLSPRWEWAAAAAGRDCAKPDPATGYFGLSLPGIDAPGVTDRPDKAERDLLLAGGVSTWLVSGTGVVLDRLVTARHEDLAGNPDTSLLALTHRRTLEYLRANWRARLAAKYPNFKLADAADVVPAPGSKILTPTTMVAEAIAWFVEMRDGPGLVQDLEAFKAELLAEVNSGDANRLDVFSPPRLIRELVTIATVIQPR